MCNATTARIAADIVVLPATRSVAKGAGIIESDARVAGGSSVPSFQFRANVEQPAKRTTNGKPISNDQSAHGPEYQLVIR